MIRGQGGVSGKTGSGGGFKSGSGMEANYACRLLSNLNALRQDSSGFNLCDVEIVAGLDQVKIIFSEIRELLAASHRPRQL